MNWRQTERCSNILGENPILDDDTESEEADQTATLVGGSVEHPIARRDREGRERERDWRDTQQTTCAADVDL